MMVGTFYAFSSAPYAERGFLWLNIRIDLAVENVDLPNSVKRVMRKLDPEEIISSLR
jgi:hypothetical protein